MIITKARCITEDDMDIIMVNYDDSEKEMLLFSYFNDEIKINPEDLIGMDKHHANLFRLDLIKQAL